MYCITIAVGPSFFFETDVIKQAETISQKETFPQWRNTLICAREIRHAR